MCMRRESTTVWVDQRRTRVLQRINTATEQARTLNEAALLEALEAIGKSWSAIP